MVELGDHSCDIELTAYFYRPDGQLLGSIDVSAAPNVRSAVLGLDWEARVSDTAWAPGKWTVYIRANHVYVAALKLNVE